MNSTFFADNDAVPGDGLCPEDGAKFRCSPKFVTDIDRDCSQISKLSN